MGMVGLESFLSCDEQLVSTIKSLLTHHFGIKKEYRAFLCGNAISDKANCFFCSTISSNELQMRAQIHRIARQLVQRWNHSLPRLHPLWVCTAGQLTAFITFIANVHSHLTVNPPPVTNCVAITQ